MSDRERKSLFVDFEKKQVSQKGEFEGYGAVFGNVDYDGDIVEHGAFAEDLAEWAAKGQLPPVAWMHNLSEPIGEYREIREDEAGLFVKGVLWVDGNLSNKLPIEKAAQAYNLLTGNGPKGLSIGYIVLKSRWSTVRRGAEDVTVRIIEKAKLLEISVVGYGANPEAVVTDAKAAPLLQEDGAVNLKNLEKHLRDAGLSKKAAVVFASAGKKAVEGLSRSESEQKAALLSALQSLKSSIEGEI